LTVRNSAKLTRTGLLIQCGEAAKTECQESFHAKRWRIIHQNEVKRLRDRIRKASKPDEIGGCPTEYNSLTLGGVKKRVRQTTEVLTIGAFRVCLVLFLLGMSSPPVCSQESAPLPTPPPEVTSSGQAQSPRSAWRYGAYLDLSYPIDFNFPENHQWRSKVTTQRVNELTPNMALAYVRKDANESSRWGMELAAQTGNDVNGQVPNASLRFGDPYRYSNTYNDVSRANVSYLAPVGNGLKLTAGLMNSFIGYESFYAKDNMNYTRTYLADNSPYFMFGVAAQYQWTEAVKSVFYVINRYNYLSYANNLPSYGTRVSWTVSPYVTFT